MILLMKLLNKVSIGFLMILMFILTTSCEKKQVPVLTTSEITNIAGTTATSGGTITDEGSGTVISRGVCWSTGTAPSINDNKTSDGAGAGTFTSDITGLNGATRYYVRGYATNSVGTGYGMAMSFTTMGQKPTAITLNATNVTSTSATLNGAVNANYLSTSIVIQYGTTSNYTDSIVASQSPVSGNESINVNASINSLIPNTNYFYRLKASNSIGISYGNQISFKTNPILVTGLSLDMATVEILKEESVQLIATVLPENASNKSVIWSSSNNLIATVNNGLVKGIAVGTTNIEAKTEDGGFKATCVIKVNPIHVTGIILNTKTISLIENETYQLSTIITPDNADNKNLIWTSSDINVATVNSNGLITTLALGNTEIKVTTIDGGFFDKCNLSVVKITDRISLAFNAGMIIDNTGVTYLLYSTITNNSNYSITLTKLEVLDSSSGIVRYVLDDNNQLGILEAGKSLKRGVSSKTNIYSVIFKWYFTYNGNGYTVQHQIDK